MRPGTTNITSATETDSYSKQTLGPLLTLPYDPSSHVPPSEANVKTFLKNRFWDCDDANENDRKFPIMQNVGVTPDHLAPKYYVVTLDSSVQALNHASAIHLETGESSGIGKYLI